MEVSIKFKKTFLYEIFQSDKVYQLSDEKVSELFDGLILEFVKFETSTFVSPTSYRGIGMLQTISNYHHRFGKHSNENFDIDKIVPTILDQKSLVELQAKLKLEHEGYVFGRYGDIVSPTNKPKLSVTLFTIFREKESNELLTHYTFTGHCYVDLLNQYNILKTLDNGKPIHVRV